MVKKLCKLDAIETVEPPVEGRAPVHDLEDGSDGSTTKQVEDKGLLALERAEARAIALAAAAGARPGRSPASRRADSAPSPP